ncbi:hypothetical protein A6P54_00170 [Bacillus sp. MKU004]|nr:hypothetical protein A6P54_00170 [Bacillus sp. MKU004]
MMANQASLNQNKGIYQMLKDSMVKEKQDLETLSAPQLKAVYKQERSAQHPHSGYSSIRFMS